MSVTSTTTITVVKTGMTYVGPINAAPAPFVNSAAPPQATSQSFAAATFAAVTVPTGATGVLMCPPAGNVGTITLKGITGDTGVTLHKTQPTFLALDTSATFGLLCSALTAIDFVWS